MKLSRILVSVLLPLIFQQCQQDDVASLNLAPIDATSAQAVPIASLKPIGSGVMMQAFYWNVPAGGTWWNTISGKAATWSQVGIDAVWLPPVSKALAGASSMGYDPFDYYDLGQYAQKGSTETRFGSKTELEQFIATAHRNQLSVIADIVINHNSGGDAEFNVFKNTNTYTDYQPASGLFNRSQYDFHPNDYHNNDTGFFGGFADVCHHKPYVQDWLWGRSNSVAKYYKNTVGFDGWRFDYVKGFEPWVAREWQRAVGGFAVGEYWDGNAATLQAWTDQAEMSAFDFACYYRMRDAFTGNNLNALNGDMLWKRDARRAVTFVANHDTDEIIDNKMLAYAYILTHEGYPALFYRDYEEWLDKDALNNLIWIHNTLAGGSTTNLYTDNDEYLARRNGAAGKNGLIVYINNSDSRTERWVPTNWSGQRIKDYTGNSAWEPVTQSDRWVKLEAPARGFTVWSVKE